MQMTAQSICQGVNYVPTYQTSYMTKQLWHWHFHSKKRKRDKEREKNVCISWEYSTTIRKQPAVILTHIYTSKNTLGRLVCSTPIASVVTKKDNKYDAVLYCLCSLPSLQNPSCWKYLSCLYHCTSFAECQLLKLARVKSVDMRQYTLCILSMQYVETWVNIPEQTRVLLLLCKKKLT